MRAYRAYVLGCGLGLALLGVVAGLQAATVAASPDGAMAGPVTDVNRALKSDRLPLVTPAENASSAPSLRAPYPRLPDGCEATVSAMARSSLAHTPGRCIS
jgi:hypothetical protein